MNEPLGLFLKELMREAKLGNNVTITDDNASPEIPLPSLMRFDASTMSPNDSMSLSMFQTSSSSLDSVLSTGSQRSLGTSSSRWDSIPNMDGSSERKAKRERIPRVPRRSMDEAQAVMLMGDLSIAAMKDKNSSDGQQRPTNWLSQDTFELERQKGRVHDQIPRWCTTGSSAWNKAITRQRTIHDFCIGKATSAKKQFLFRLDNTTRPHGYLYMHRNDESWTAR